MAKDRQPTEATVQSLHQVKTKWDKHITYTSSIPTINLLVHETVIPVETFTRTLMLAVQKGYSIPQEDTDSSWEMTQEAISQMALDTVKIGLEFRELTDGITVEPAFEAATHLLVSARFEIGAGGIRLINAINKKEKIVEENPGLTKDNWNSILLKCQKACFNYGFSLSDDPL